MRTVIQGGWVIGYAGGSHRLLRDGVVVIEGDRIEYVGPQFAGIADRTIDAQTKIVMPGLIDLHVHVGTLFEQRWIQDAGRRDFLGTPNYHFLVAREGSTLPTEPVELGARWTATELLRFGTTTFAEVGALLSDPQAIAAEVERWGLRAYLGPNFASARRGSGPQGQLLKRWDHERGKRMFYAACEFIRRYDGRANGRIRGMIAPLGTETVSPELFQMARKAATDLGVPFQTHGAQSQHAFFESITEYQLTPVEFLEEAGVLGPDVTLGHGNFIAEASTMDFAGGRDLEILARTGTSIAHCPVNIARRGRVLDHWERYRAAGVNIALGTDTYPRDLILNMRAASLMGKTISRSYLAAPASDVFAAATLGGARALGRDDLGRLARGAKADVVIVNPNHVRWGAVRDPIKSLVEAGQGDDVETVIIDGIIRMENGVIPGLDLPKLLDEVRAEAERQFALLPTWNPLGQSYEEMCPWSYPLWQPEDATTETLSNSGAVRS